MSPFPSMAHYVATQNMMKGPSPVDFDARTGVQQLEARVERQHLIIQTLLILLLEKKVIQEEEFKEWMGYVDELDGVRDGRLREDKSPAICPACGRNSPRSAATCQYCGEPLEGDFLSRRPPAS